jgi:hypothetical protein
MKMTNVPWIIRQALCLVCVPFLAGGLAVAQQPAPSEQALAPLLPPEQLDSLVAPIALYPDALLSQILVAATYPQEIVEAGQWLQQNRNLQGPQLVDAARQQNWDPSIQALVVFPDVINRMNADMRWTTDLGNAFLSQQADVMNAVQQMRAQAMSAGRLRSNAQETVTTQREGDQTAIDIQPANPEMVYVPYYNPAYIWGPPAYGYYPAWDYPYAGFGFGFGPGIYIGGFFGGLGWGGWGWGPNWFHHSIFLNGGFFNHYGLGGRGFAAGAVWAHNPVHRLGVPYSNSALAHRYGGISTARAGAGRFGAQPYATQQRSPSAQRGNLAAPAYRGNSGYRASPSYSGSYGGNRAAPSYRSSPSYGNGGAYRATPSYGGSYGGNRATPSYGGSYGGNRTAPSYRSSPSYGNSGNRATPSSRGSYGGSRSAPSHSSQSSGGGGSRSSPSSSGGGSHSGGSSHGGGSRR